MVAQVLIVGRVSEQAAAVRGEAFAAGQRYFRAVDRAGAVPLLLPPMTSLLDRVHDVVRRVDAVVLHGGGDVDPRRYGAPATAEQVYGVVVEHDEVELAVVQAALAADVPVLAICRGAQVLNVALGGTLHQHIGDAHWFVSHEVDVEPGSRLAKAVGGDHVAAAHSVHHQALDRIGDGLVVTGRSADGTVEAVEVADARWVLGVQWHPEDTAEGDPEQQALFDELVRQAGDGRGR